MHLFYNRLTTKRVVFIILFFSIITYSAVLFAKNSGVISRTAPNQGCDCHGNQANSATVLTAKSESGSFTFKPGEKVKLTVTVSNPVLTKAGINIAIKTSLTGSTNAGTLSAITSGLKVSGGEIVQSSALTLTNNKVDFEFYWTAPTTKGTYYLRAVGNAINGNGQESGDEWNWLTPVTLTVDEVQGVENENSMDNLSAFPNPSSHGFEIVLSSVNSNISSISIIDLNGNLIRNFETINNSNENNKVYWNGLKTNGEEVSPGVYFAIVNDGLTNNVVKLVKTTK